MKSDIRCSFAFFCFNNTMGNRYWPDFRLNQKGESMLAVMVAIGIASILIFIIMQMVTNQNTQIKFFQQKSDALELKNDIALGVASKPFCHFNISNGGKTLDTTAVPTTGISTTAAVSYAELYNGTSATAPKLVSVADTSLAGMRVAAITLKEIEFTGFADFYRGNFVVDFDQSTSVRSIAPIKIRVNFNVDPTGPATARPIMGCNSPGDIDRVTAMWKGTRTYAGQVAVNMGTVPCKKARIIVDYGGRFVGSGNDSMGTLHLRVNGSNVSSRRGGSDASGGRISIPASTVQGTWVGACTGASITLYTYWENYQVAPYLDEAYLKYEYMD